MYLMKKQFVNLFVTCKRFLDFSDQIVRQDYSSVCVHRSHGPCICSKFQIVLIYEQQTVYGVARNGSRIGQNLDVRRNLPSQFKSVKSYNSKKEWTKHIRYRKKWQPTGCINPCSQRNISPLRRPVHRRDTENYLGFVMEIEENELNKEWWGRRAIYISK
jgi:hypothetical protein